MKRIFFWGCLALLVSCSGQRKISNQNMAYLYAPGMNFIYPGYRICNLNPDTSRVFFEIPVSDLLYMKEDTSGMFKASFAIGYRVLPGFESRTVVDTGLNYYNSIHDDDSTG